MARFTPACPTCENNHDPAIECRYAALSAEQMQLNTKLVASLYGMLDQIETTLSPCPEHWFPTATANCPEGGKR